MMLQNKLELSARIGVVSHGLATTLEQQKQEVETECGTLLALSHDHQCLLYDVLCSG